MDKMNRKVIETADGSPTILIEDSDITYHSRHGAVQESMHVFIKSGLEYYINSHTEKKNLSIFEMGLGTGLNLLLTHEYSLEHKLNIYYEAVEQYPLEKEIAETISYPTVPAENNSFLRDMHAAPWNETVHTIGCSYRKVNTQLEAHNTKQKFDIVYYDAFAPNAQPVLWTEDIFRKLYNMMNDSGVLVTYCSKGDVRRAMLVAGFKVEKIPGPPRKREMLRATKYT